MFNIEFIGGRSDIRPLLKRFDVFVCRSSAESSPLSVMGSDGNVEASCLNGCWGSAIVCD